MIFLDLGAGGRAKVGKNSKEGLLCTQVVPHIDIRTLQMEGEMGNMALERSSCDWNQDYKKTYNLRC